MNITKFVLGLSTTLAVIGLVACGDDSASASNSGEELESSSSITQNENDVSSSSIDGANCTDEFSNCVMPVSSSSSLAEDVSSSSSEPDCIVLESNSSSSSFLIPSCGQNVTWQETCVDTEFEGEVCDAIGCGALDCFENQKGWHALSCDGGSVMICDGTRWQYTNCVLPIIGSSSSSVENASSSSAYDPAGANGKPCEIESEERYVGPYAYVCRDGQLTFSEDLSDPCDADNDCGSSEYPEGWQNEPCSTEDEVRLDETFEYRCVGGKWSIQGYNPNLVDPNAERCRSSEIEGSACDVSGDLSHMSVNGCEFFCYGGKWEYTPPPM